MLTVLWSLFTVCCCCCCCGQSHCIGNVQSQNLAVTTRSASLDDGGVITMMTAETGLMREIVVSSGPYVRTCGKLNEFCNSETTVN